MRPLRPLLVGLLCSFGCLAVRAAEPRAPVASEPAGANQALLIGIGLVVLALVALTWVVPLVRANRRLRANERQYRLLAENAPFPIAISDLETSEILFTNRRVLEMFGDTGGQDFVGEHAMSFYENPADRERLLEGLRTHGVVTGMEMRFVRGGRAIWTQLSAGVVEFAGRKAIVLSFHDITRRRVMEDELRTAKEAAEAADAAKGRYLGVLSHEIRTPLNGLLGVAALLRVEQLSAEGREHLEILERSGQTLLRLINDLLDFSRYDSGRVELEELPLEPGPFLKELCTLFRPAAEAKNLALAYAVRPEVPAMVLSDPIRLRQILSNLLSNAIKFTAKGSVEIVVEVAPTGGAAVPGRSRLRFHVSDTGVGIPAEQLAHLFEPWVQGDATVARRYGGTGLGLSISKRLAQLLGGGIRVQSSPGAGSMFTVEIEAAVMGAKQAASLTQT